MEMYLDVFTTSGKQMRNGKYQKIYINKHCLPPHMFSMKGNLLDKAPVHVVHPFDLFSKKWMFGFIRVNRINMYEFKRINMSVVQTALDTVHKSP